MEIRHIRSFLAVADELHFSRAAKRVQITQPTLSQHIQILERDLDVQLVTRTSRRVELTPGGHAFLAKARTALTEFEQAREDARLAAAGRMGSIRIGYSSVARRTVLPGAFDSFQSELSRVQLSMRQLRTGPQLGALLAGDIDVALVSGKPTDAELSAVELHPLQVRVVMGRSDPLAGRTAVRFRDVVDRACILFEREESPMMHDVIVSGAAQAGVDLEIGYVVTDAWHANALVATRALIGFASDVHPRLTRSGQPADRQMINIPLIEPTPRIALHAVWRTAGSTSVVVRFVDALSGAAQRLMERAGSAENA